MVERSARSLSSHGQRSNARTAEPDGERLGRTARFVVRVVKLYITAAIALPASYGLASTYSKLAMGQVPTQSETWRCVLTHPAWELRDACLPFEPPPQPGPGEGFGAMGPSESDLMATMQLAQLGRSGTARGIVM